MDLSIRIPFCLPISTDKCIDCEKYHDICDGCLLIHACYHHDIKNIETSVKIWRHLLIRWRLYKNLKSVKTDWIYKACNIRLKNEWPTDEEYISLNLHR